MKQEFYYVYCEGILGLKTNIAEFKWIYGSVAPHATNEEFDECDIKFEIYKIPEHKLKACKTKNQFQSYYWNEINQTISCRRTFFKKLQIGYDITLKNKNVIVEMGDNYYSFVRKRIMNLHGAYYLLSDLANMILLENGYLTFYASGVKGLGNGKSIVFFAPPNTGKTLTATNLATKYGYSLIGEDVIIVKDRKLYPCPWTSSYRNEKSIIDNAGAVFRKKNLKTPKSFNSSYLTDIVVLMKGKNQIIHDKSEVLRRVSILNGYLFSYYSSPIIKILGYFSNSYCKDWNSFANEKIENLHNQCDCHIVCSENPMDFCDLVQDIVGEYL